MCAYLSNNVIAYAGCKEREENMAIDYISVGKRIKYYRMKANLSQEALGERLHLSRKHISVIELGSSSPSLDTLVDIANKLAVSADDLLVDSLEHHTSTADTELHRLLLDCNEIEEQILIRTVKELKAILYGLGI